MNHQIQQRIIEHHSEEQESSLEDDEDKQGAHYEEDPDLDDIQEIDDECLLNELKNLQHGINRKGNNDKSVNIYNRNGSKYSRSESKYKSPSGDINWDQYYLENCKMYLTKKNSELDKKRKAKMDKEMKNVFDKPNLVSKPPSNNRIPLIKRISVIVAKKESDLAKLKQQKQEEEDEKEAHELTFHPKINKTTSKRQGQNQNRQEYLYNISTTKSLTPCPREDDGESLFQPKINRTSEVLAKKRVSNSGLTDFSDRLYKDAETRMKKREQKAQERAPKFKPQLNKKTQKICQQIDDLNKFIEDEENEKDDNSHVDGNRGRENSTIENQVSYYQEPHQASESTINQSIEAVYANNNPYFTESDSYGYQRERESVSPENLRSKKSSLAKQKNKKIKKFSGYDYRKVKTEAKNSQSLGSNDDEDNNIYNNNNSDEQVALQTKNQRVSIKSGGQVSQKFQEKKVNHNINDDNPKVIYLRADQRDLLRDPYIKQNFKVIIVDKDNNILEQDEGNPILEEVIGNQIHDKKEKNSSPSLKTLLAGKASRKSKLDAVRKSKSALKSRQSVSKERSKDTYSQERSNNSQKKRNTLGSSSQNSQNASSIESKKRHQSVYIEDMYVSKLEKDDLHSYSLSSNEKNKPTKKSEKLKNLATKTDSAKEQHLEQQHIIHKSPQRYVDKSNSKVKLRHNTDGEVYNPSSNQETQRSSAETEELISAMRKINNTINFGDSSTNIDNQREKILSILNQSLDSLQKQPEYNSNQNNTLQNTSLSPNKRQNYYQHQIQSSYQNQSPNSYGNRTRSPHKSRSPTRGYPINNQSPHKTFSYSNQHEQKLLYKNLSPSRDYQNQSGTYYNQSISQNGSPQLKDTFDSSGFSPLKQRYDDYQDDHIINQNQRNPYPANFNPYERLRQEISQQVLPIQSDVRNSNNNAGHYPLNDSQKNKNLSLVKKSYEKDTISRSNNTKISQNNYTPSQEVKKSPSRSKKSPSPNSSRRTQREGGGTTPERIKMKPLNSKSPNKFNNIVSSQQSSQSPNKNRQQQQQPHRQQYQYQQEINHPNLMPSRQEESDQQFKLFDQNSPNHQKLIMTHEQEEMEIQNIENNLKQIQDNLRNLRESFQNINSKGPHNQQIQSPPINQLLHFSPNGQYDSSKYSSKNGDSAYKENYNPYKSPGKYGHSGKQMMAMSSPQNRGYARSPPNQKYEQYSYQQKSSPVQQQQKNYNSMTYAESIQIEPINQSPKLPRFGKNDYSVPNEGYQNISCFNEYLSNKEDASQSTVSLTDVSNQAKKKFEQFDSKMRSPEKEFTQQEAKQFKVTVNSQNHRNQKILPTSQQITPNEYFQKNMNNQYNSPSHATTNRKNSRQEQQYNKNSLSATKDYFQKKPSSNYHSFFSSNSPIRQNLSAKRSMQ